MFENNEIKRSCLFSGKTTSNLPLQWRLSTSQTLWSTESCVYQSMLRRFLWRKCTVLGSESWHWVQVSWRILGKPVCGVYTRYWSSLFDWCVEFSYNVLW